MINRFVYALVIFLLGATFIKLYPGSKQVPAVVPEKNYVVASSTVRSTTTIFKKTRFLKSISDTSIYSLVARVVDGDTIELVDGRRVRYVGIDTPETLNPRKAVQCFGKEASDQNKELVLGKKVRLEKDVSEVDRYGRLLRYVYLEDGTFINLKLVQEGYAQASTWPPDVRYSKLFVEAQQKAREEGRGLWSQCK